MPHQRQDHHYENPKLVKLYDHDSPWSIDRDFYLHLANSDKKIILDLGCGTGLICNAYAECGHEVTGVDPSQAMLQIAHKKPKGREIEWVQSFSQTYSSPKRFDLIIMTGHAFQAILEDKDIMSTFETMKKHLKPDGLIVFESRNPEINWKNRWDYTMHLQTPEGLVTESRRFIKMENEKMIFKLHYQFPDETIISESHLRFSSLKTIEKNITQSGLQIEKIFGDWDSSPFKTGISEEMIFFLRHKDSP